MTGSHGAALGVVAAVEWAKKAVVASERARFMSRKYPSLGRSGAYGRNHEDTALAPHPSSDWLIVGWCFFGAFAKN